MPKFRKKPVVIEAFLVGSDDDHPEWFAEALRKGTVEVLTKGSEDNWFYRIKTLEGYHEAWPGKDWIIRGVAGEIYPCKHDIFMQTYEPVEAKNEVEKSMQT